MKLAAGSLATSSKSVAASPDLPWAMSLEPRLDFAVGTAGCAG